jgi:hypothetical protein
MTKYLSLCIFGFHAIQSAARMVMYHDMIFAKWYPFDASASPAYEITNLSQVTLQNIKPIIRGPFEKFGDSPYYFKSELYGGAVTVSFSKYLLWQAMHFLRSSTSTKRAANRLPQTSGG